MKITRATTVTQHLVTAFECLIPQLNSLITPPTRNELEAILSSDNTAIFICEDGINIVGTLTFAICNLPTGTKAWIEDVIVDESVRGLGYGKRLILHAIDYAKNYGIEKIYLTSNPSRIAANQMYQNLGFKQYETNVYRLILT